MNIKRVFIFLGILICVLAAPVVASDAGDAGGGGHSIVLTLFWIAVLLLAAKLSSLIEKIGQPSVLGELVMGMILGNLALFGITFFEPMKTDQFLPFLAELGVIILLFQVGLESNIAMAFPRFNQQCLFVFRSCLNRNLCWNYSQSV